MDTRELLFGLAERLGWTFLHSLWQGAIIGLCLAIVLLAMRRRSAAAKHAVCLAALCLMLVASCITASRVPGRTTSSPSPLPTTKVPAPTAQPPAAPTTVAVWSPLREVPAPDQSNPALFTTPNTPLTWQQRLHPFLPWISAGWLAGILILSIRHLGGWARIRHWRSTSEEVDPALYVLFKQLREKFRLSAAVRLRRSTIAFAPMLTGILRPIILLPAQLVSGLSEQQLHAVLAHELAHLARRDTWSNFLQVIIETIFFFHPVVWWISRRTRTEREHAADDLALQVCADRRLYAGALARLAELQDTPALALAAHGGSLLQRIRRIVLPPPRETATPGWLLPAIGATAILLTCLVLRAGAQETKVVVVKPGEYIQKAIDAAAPGSIVRLEAGTWKERVTITKPLTLEGAGWEKTRIQPDQLAEGVTSAAKVEFRKRYIQGLPQAEIAKLNREWIEKFERPTLLIRECENVTVRGIRFGGVTPESKDAAADETLLIARRARAALIDCSIVGPSGNGLQILEQSDVQIQKSLIAALWGEGIIVQGQNRISPGEPSRLRLIESEVRNVYHYGVLIGNGCDSTTVERCRISGTAWHGIRYDSASPTITNNVIFQNARSGIYASGKTAATVRGNVFWRNEMNGISCWFDNADTIENNTFVENLREALAVIGGVKPTVARNIFANNPIAIAYGATQGSPADPQPVLTENLFWQNKTDLHVKTESKPAPAGSLNVDPQFRDTAKHDFKPATAVGAQTPLLPTTPTPLLEEEKSIIPADETREFSYWSQPGSPKRSKAAAQAAEQSAKDAQGWIDDAFQLDDAAKRTAAIERVRAAMTSGNVEEARTGITAFVRLGPIEFDKVSFRPAVRQLLNSPDIPTRAAALNGFSLTGTESEDLARIFAMADDPAAEVRDNLPYVIVQVTKRDLTDKAPSDALLKLIARMPRDPRTIGHALWGCKLSRELETKVLELCRDMQGAGGVGYDFFYGTLSTQANKSEASCKRLIELLAHQDIINIAGRSAWGLQQGVDRAQYRLVADAMVRVIEARSDGYLRKNAFSCLRAYGSSAHVPALTAFLAKPGVTGELRTQCEEVLAVIKQRN